MLRSRTIGAVGSVGASSDVSRHRVRVDTQLLHLFDERSQFESEADKSRQAQSELPLGSGSVCRWPQDLLWVLCESLAFFAVKFFFTAKLAKELPPRRKAKPRTK